MADPGEEPGGPGPPYFETALLFSNGLDDRARPHPPPRVFSFSAILESEKTLGTR